MEACSRAIQFRDPKECDVPALICTLYHHAGWAQLLESEFEGWRARGVVVGITSRETPLQALGWLIAPALAVGCTVVLKPSRQAAPVALLLAEMCMEAGLPPGVLNVVTGDSTVGSALATHSLVDKVTFFGSTTVGRCIRQQTAQLGRSITLVLSSRTPMIVLESADLDAACEAAIESAWYNQGQVPWAVTDLLVQQSVIHVFVEKLSVRMSRLRVGSHLDKMADVGHTCRKQASEAVRMCVDKSRSDGARVLSIPDSRRPPSPCPYLIPAVVVGASAESSALLDDDWPLPCVMLNAFRTAKEAVALANNSKYSLASSIWAQDSSLAEQVAQGLQVGTVWINCVNKFDAGVPWGPSRQSGIGRIGGREGLLEYLTISPQQGTRGSEASSAQWASGGVVTSWSGEEEGRVDRTFKLYYGGGSVRPEGGSSVIMRDHKGEPYALVPDGSRKDIRNAVEAARKAQPGWWKSGAHLRAQILFYFAENLELRKTEFAKELTRLLGVAEAEALDEVAHSVECLSFWASACDKGWSGARWAPDASWSVGVAHEARGVIGVLCPPSAPLLNPLTLMAPAIALGNAVVVVPHPSCPLPLLSLCQVASTSDLPAGVLNVISGNVETLGATLASHHDVSAIWCPGSALPLCESLACPSMKPVWGCDSAQWTSGTSGSERRRYYTEIFLNATLSKAVWIPVGGMFGN
ncbi:aldehyde dehydrogenase family 16 member A1-like isoform X2 [Ischnura elegans]|nr:aldehyde dehydrogenase family 16 member A1-like isoform X2 [Ischnura elegans]